jgi:hypothetical protein
MRSVLAIAGCLAALSLSSCEDACHRLAPSFEVKVLPGPGIDPLQVGTLNVEIAVGNFHATRSFAIGGELDDGVTSFVVNLGSEVRGSFIADVTVTALDRSGAQLNVVRRSFNGVGDGCNFFELSLTCRDGEKVVCGSGVGECRQGEQTCSGGQWGACQGAVSPQDEVCDGKDNDCNGTPDDLKGSPPACELQKGVCAGAFKRCGGASGWLPCTAQDYQGAAAKNGAGYEEGKEKTCDSKDNNCDGEVDEGIIDYAKGCWDVSGRFTSASYPVDPGELKIFSQGVTAGSGVIALFAGLDDPLPVADVTCAGYPSFLGPRAWAISRQSGSAPTQKHVRIKGSSAGNCDSGAKAFDPLVQGDIALNRGWKISSVTCPSPATCQVGSGNTTLTFVSSFNCTPLCCICAEGAKVDIDVTVSH